MTLPTKAELDKLEAAARAEHPSMPGHPAEAAFRKALVNFWRTSGRKLCEDGMKWRQDHPSGEGPETHPGDIPMISTVTDLLELRKLREKATQGVWQAIKRESAMYRGHAPDSDPYILSAGKPILAGLWPVHENTPEATEAAEAITFSNTNFIAALVNFFDLPSTQAMLENWREFGWLFENDNDKLNAALEGVRVTEHDDAASERAERDVLPSELVVGAGHFHAGVEIAMVQGAIDRMYERLLRVEANAESNARDAERLDWLLHVMKARNVQTIYYERTHEIDGPTCVLQDRETGHVLGYDSTARAAIDAARREGDEHG